MKTITVLLIMLTSLSASPQSEKSGCCKPNTTPAKETATPEKPAAEPAADPLEQLLGKMHEATRNLNSCQTNLSYLLIQDPDLLDSRTLRNGMLYYQKQKERSQLRIRFDDVKQDDFEPEKHRQEYLFDGVWLTRIDFKLKQIDRYQQAPKDKPIDVFELINNNFPLVGFSNIEHLKRDFDIGAPEEADKKDLPEDTVRLLLKTKKGSRHEKEYKKIDIWVSTKNYMPLRIVAYSVQGDIHDIKFTEFNLNKKLKNAVFTIETPADFSKNEEPLKKKPTEKGE